MERGKGGKAGRIKPEEASQTDMNIGLVNGKKNMKAISNVTDGSLFELPTWMGLLNFFFSLTCF